MRSTRSFPAASILLVIGFVLLPATTGPFSPARAARARELPQQAPQKPEPLPPTDPTLAPILAKAAAYCRRLEDSAFDFVCREEISETINPKLDAAAKSSAVNAASGAYNPETTAYLGPTFVIRTVKKVKRTFVYDYQCVRAGRTIRETRAEIEENGKSKYVPNAKLDTTIVVWGTALLGPVGLFGERVQDSYVYTSAGGETIGGIPTLVIDAKPKPGAPPSQSLYGKAWIDPATGDILKIEWSESRVGHFDVFAQRGKLFERTPQLRLVSEFSVEKNGLRFPTHFRVEEAYLNDSGKAFIRSTTDVVYKDFKFFTVEVEVTR